MYRWQFIIKNNIFTSEELNEMSSKSYELLYYLDKLEKHLRSTKELPLKEHSRIIIREYILNNNYDLLKWKNRYLELLGLDRYSKIKKFLINKIDELFIDEFSEFLESYSERILHLVNNYNLPDEIIAELIDSKFQIIAAQNY